MLLYLFNRLSTVVCPLSAAESWTWLKLSVFYQSLSGPRQTVGYVLYRSHPLLTLHPLYHWRCFGRSWKHISAIIYALRTLLCSLFVIVLAKVVLLY